MAMSPVQYVQSNRVSHAVASDRDVLFEIGVEPDIGVCKEFVPRLEKTTSVAEYS